MKKRFLQTIAFTCMTALMASCAHDPYLAPNAQISPAPGRQQARASDVLVPLAIGAAATALIVKSRKDRKKHRNYKRDHYKHRNHHDHYRHRDYRHRGGYYEHRDYGYYRNNRYNDDCY